MTSYVHIIKLIIDNIGVPHKRCIDSIQTIDERSGSLRPTRLAKTKTKTGYFHEYCFRTLSYLIHLIHSMLSTSVVNIPVVGWQVFSLVWWVSVSRLDFLSSSRTSLQGIFETIHTSHRQREREREIEISHSVPYWRENFNIFFGYVEKIRKQRCQQLLVTKAESLNNSQNVSSSFFF